METVGTCDCRATGAGPALRPRCSPGPSLYSRPHGPSRRHSAPRETTCPSLSTCHPHLCLPTPVVRAGAPQCPRGPSAPRSVPSASWPGWRPSPAPRSPPTSWTRAGVGLGPAAPGLGAQRAAGSWLLLACISNLSASGSENMFHPLWDTPTHTNVGEMMVSAVHASLTCVLLCRFCNFKVLSLTRAHFMLTVTPRERERRPRRLWKGR